MAGTVLDLEIWQGKIQSLCLHGTYAEIVETFKTTKSTKIISFLIVTSTTMKGKEMGVMARKASLKRLLPRDQTEVRTNAPGRENTKYQGPEVERLRCFQKMTRRHSAGAQ